MSRLRRVFIIGAGASADAGMALGDELLQKVMYTANNVQTTEKEFLNLISNVKSRINIIYRNILSQDKYPNFEDYLNLVYDFSKGANIVNVKLPPNLSALSKGLDKDVMILLYWYLYTACRRWAGPMSIDYIPDFISAEVYLNSDAVISLNYDWLFERVLIKTVCGQENPETIRIGFGTNVCDIAGGNVTKIYGDKSKNSLFKPHGSANWLICKKGKIFQDNGTMKMTIAGDTDLPILSNSDTSEIVVCFCNEYIDYKVLQSKSNELLIGIIPPIGIKGYLGSKMICKLLNEKDTDNKDKYSIFEKLISGQVSGSVKAIHSLKDDGEIWLVGTKLFIDPYLYNQVRLKKINSPEIKIVFIAPDETAAKKLAEDFGTVYHFNGTLKEYSILLKIRNGNKTGRWNGLNLNNDFNKIVN